MDVLNRAYRPSNVHFTLRGIDRTINGDWARGRDGLGMKRRLRRGDYRTLNLYFIDRDEKTNALGLCYYPTDAEKGSKGFYLDGCVLAAQSTPGGSLPDNNLGQTATHEVGHWMGLMHTFAGGCAEEGGGDMVADTPAQANATVGCPIGRDSCPGKPGLDPIHNYMDYSREYAAALPFPSLPRDRAAETLVERS
ncbi:hypothetical protein CDD83_5788 [Cordyceps sp. RAO-2017]|nr:hypothetical protein CDD83_5788 [Cordyceps sp. RAO-2017]